MFSPYSTNDSIRWSPLSVVLGYGAARAHSNDDDCGLKFVREQMRALRKLRYSETVRNEGTYRKVIARIFRASYFVTIRKKKGKGGKRRYSSDGSR